MAEPLTPFATVDQLEAFWKPLTDAEKTRATSLLELASNRLRSIGKKSGVDVDARAEDDAAYASDLQWVVMEATKRAMLTPSDQAPVDTFQQTAGPYSVNYKYTNPSGDLWFKKSELSELDLNYVQKITSINGTQADIYGS